MNAILTRPLTVMTVLAASFFSVPAHADNAATNAHDFVFTAIEGDPLPMSRYAGKPVLVVNTASRCGFTYQYDGLQALYDRYRDEGLIVLGVPSQDFRQELATSEEVKKFCEVNFDLDFPMTEIEGVRGKDAHPLFRWLADQGAKPDWNFNKFLIDPDGEFVMKYGSSVKPDSPKVTDRIAEML